MASAGPARRDQTGLSRCARPPSGTGDRVPHPGGGACSRPGPRAPPPRRGPEGASPASVSAGDARRAELRPEDATRAQFRRGGRASDSDGGGVGAPSCGEAAGAPDCEPGPEEGGRVGSGGRGGRWARRGPVTVAGPGAAPSRPAGAAGLGPGARPRRARSRAPGSPRPRPWDPARRASVARSLPAPGARAWVPAGSRRAGARSAGTACRPGSRSLPGRLGPAVSCRESSPGVNSGPLRLSL